MGKKKFLQQIISAFWDTVSGQALIRQKTLRFFLPLLACAAAVLCYTGMFYLHLPPWQILLTALTGASFLMSALVLLFRTLFEPHREMPISSQFRVTRRYYAWALIAWLLLSGTTAIFHFRETTVKNRLNILVIRLSGPQTSDSEDFTEALVYRLRNETADMKNTCIHFLDIPFQENLSSPDTLRLARMFRADMVVWGWYGHTGSSTRIGLHLRCPNMPASGKNLLNTQIQDFNNHATLVPGKFTIEAQGMQSLQLYSRFISGLCRCLSGHFRSASVELTTPVLENYPDLETFLSFFRALSFQKTGKFSQAERSFHRALKSGASLRNKILFNLAVNLVSGKNFTTAEKIFLSLKKKFPGLCALHYNLGNLYCLQKKFRKGEAYFSRALHTDPSFSPARFNRALAFFRQKKYAGAESEFSHPQLLNKATAELHYFRGLARYFQNNFSGAARDLQVAVAKKPLWFKAAFNLGTVFARMGNLDMAVYSFTRSLALEPHNTASLQNRGQAFLLQGNCQQASRDFANALSRKPDSSELLKLRGISLLLSGIHKAARKNFSRMIELKKDAPRAYFFRGSSWLAAGLTDKAAADFTSALAIQPEFVPALRGRALARMNAGNLTGARADVERAMNISVSRINWMLTGMIKRRQEKFNEAVSAFTHAVSISPWLAEPRFQRGVTCLLSGEIQRAQNDFRQIVSEYPEHHRAFNYLGLACLLADDFNNALRSFNAACRIVPDETAYVLSRANTCLLMGRSDQAIADFRRAAALDSQNPFPDLFISQAHEQDGQFVKALENYRKILKKKTSPGNIRKAVKRRITELERDLLRLNILSADTEKQ